MEKDGQTPCRLEEGTKEKSDTNKDEIVVPSYKRRNINFVKVVLIIQLISMSLFPLMMIKSLKYVKKVTQIGDDGTPIPGVEPIFNFTKRTYSSEMKQVFDPTQYWGSHSPYFEGGPNFPGINPSYPDICSIKQVHVLHRHGERFPTAENSYFMKMVAEKIKAGPGAPSLPWFSKWSYFLKEDLMVTKGLGTEFSSGSDFWASHGRDLYNATEKAFTFYDNHLNLDENGNFKRLPVIRATTQSRIKVSAQAWAAGFFGMFAEDPNHPYRAREPDRLYNLILQNEGEGYNSTLASYYSCKKGLFPAFLAGATRVQKWVNIYLKDAASRLTNVFGVELNPLEVHQIQRFCVYETAATSTVSPFCELFTTDEWRGYSYSEDLDFVGSAGGATPYGKAQGSGWLYELLGRLEHRLLPSSKFGTNASLTNHEDVFPIDQLFYLDLSHDSVIISVLNALGLEFLENDLPVNHIPFAHNFEVSRLTPFGARLYVEVLDCGEQTLSVRLKLNNRILPLRGLKNCPANSEGLCSFQNFTDSLKAALDSIDFDKICYYDPIYTTTNLQTMYKMPSSNDFENKITNDEIVK